MLGKQAKADLPSAVFGEELHESLVQEAARADLAARRRGTASTLGRGEVAMTTAKAWRQKGTGRARAGALSVPHRRGGGVAFGPDAARLRREGESQGAAAGAAGGALRARRSRQRRRARRGELRGAERPSGPRRRSAKWGAKHPTLVVLDREEDGAAKSFRNIPEVSVMAASDVDVADIVGHALAGRLAERARGARGPRDRRRAGGEHASTARPESSEESEQSEDSED